MTEGALDTLAVLVIVESFLGWLPGLGRAGAHGPGKDFWEGTEQVSWGTEAQEQCPGILSLWVSRILALPIL